MYDVAKKAVKYLWGWSCVYHFFHHSCDLKSFWASHIWITKWTLKFEFYHIKFFQTFYIMVIFIPLFSATMSYSGKTIQSGPFTYFKINSYKLYILKIWPPIKWVKDRNGPIQLIGRRCLKDLILDPTIWDMYLTLDTKYQEAAISSCWEKCYENNFSTCPTNIHHLDQNMTYQSPCVSSCLFLPSNDNQAEFLALCVIFFFLPIWLNFT